MIYSQIYATVQTAHTNPETVGWFVDVTVSGHSLLLAPFCRRAIPAVRAEPRVQRSGQGA